MKQKLAIALLACSGLVSAGDFDWGGDLRVRYTDLGDIPTNIGSLAFDQGFWRIRPRVWTQYKPTDGITLKGRLTNEFRFYRDSSFPPGSDKWDPLSEVIVDTLYADFQNLANNKLSLRVGRQDMIYGTGKIILDGTPLDGSRTIYFNAVKAGVELPSDNHIDLLAIFNKAEDKLVINGQGEHERYGYDSIAVVEQDESALGFYGKNKHFEGYPFEYYYIYKEEDARDSGLRPDVNFHTYGARVMPKFSDQFKGNFELALQNGDHGSESQKGTLFDGSLTWSFGGNLNPQLVGGYYYLSGDDASTSKNESWHQVFARWPQISELYIYSYVGTDYSVSGWTNLQTPYIGLDMVPFQKSKLALRYYNLQAEEKDGPGTGDKRGDLLTALLKFTINDHLSGHLRAEYLDPGNYYAKGTDSASFLRANVIYKF